MLPWRGLQFLIGLLIACSSARHIAANGRLIQALARGCEVGLRCGSQVHLLDGRRLDVVAMAITARVEPGEIERRLANRRRQAGRDAKWCLLGAIWFLALWFYEMLRSPTGFASLGYSMATIGTFVAFALMAFYNAMVNWQIRTHRLGTVSEFMKTRDGWWPV